MTPALNFPPELLLRKAQGMRVAFFDVDGVLTDGGLYMSTRASRSSASTSWTATASSCCSAPASRRP
jgi:hypothetical protein